MRKFLFVPLAACLDDRLQPQGDRFTQAKTQIATNLRDGWQVFITHCAEWGQGSYTPNPETNRYTLPDNRWGVRSRGTPNQRINWLADHLEALQPLGHPTMRGLFCPNKRNDMVTEFYQVRFTHRQTLSNVHYSFEPFWAHLVDDGAGNSAYRLPSAGMMKRIVASWGDRDRRIAAVWHDEPDRVSANMIEAPLYSSDEWLSGIDPYERSKFFNRKPQQEPLDRDVPTFNELGG